MTLLFTGAGIAFGGVAVLLFLFHKAHGRTQRGLADAAAVIEREEPRDDG